MFFSTLYLITDLNLFLALYYVRDNEHHSVSISENYIQSGNTAMTQRCGIIPQSGVHYPPYATVTNFTLLVLYEFADQIHTF